MDEMPKKGDPSEKPERVPAELAKARKAAVKQLIRDRPVTHQGWLTLMARAGKEVPWYLK